MRKVLIALGAIVLLVIIAAVAAPFFIPLDWVKQQAAERVEAATGRQLTIAGDVSLSLLPRVQLEVNDVRFANRDGSDVADMASLSNLGLDIDLMPLLDGELVVERFVLIEPVIHLETDASGQGNWVFETMGGATADTSATGGEAESGAASGGPGLSDLRLGDVRIENGRLTFRDGQTGELTELSEVNLTLSVPTLTGPGQAQGSVVYKGERVLVDGGVGSLEALLAGASAPTTMTMQSGPLTASFDGAIATGGSLEGDIDLSIPSLRALSSWLAKPLPADSQAPEAVTVKGRLAMAGDRIDFTGAEVTADALRATGDLGLDLSGERPRVSANLAADMLDLNPYLPQTETEQAAGGSGEGASGGGNAAAPATEEWSDEEIDFSALDMVNADLAFELGGLKIRDIEIGRSVLAIALDNGSATLDLVEAQLYGGSGTAHVEIDRSGGRPAIHKTLAVSGIAAEPLLIAATGFDKLSGTGDIALDITTTGVSERQFVTNLMGDGSFVFRDGAFKGANLAEMARNISLDALNASVSPNQSTDFAELSATFTITNGVLRNDDLFMAAPLLRLSGNGNVNLPPRTLDYSVTLRPVASLQGQGTDQADAAGGIPVLVRGPWSDPSIQPDLEALAKGLMENPQAVQETLENLGVNSGDAGKLLENLGGGEGGGNLLDSLGGDAKGAADAIKGLFD